MQAGLQHTTMSGDPAGALYILDGSVSPDIAAAAVINSQFMSDLQRAATHYDGRGMEDDGIDTSATFALVRSLK